MLIGSIVSFAGDVNNGTAMTKFQERVMQKSRLWMFAVIAMIVLAATAIAQDKKPASPPEQTKLTFADGKTVTIDYSAPSMRGRTIFGGLVPYDEVWRTGANAATSLKTDVDLLIGGETVPKGEYTLYTLPGRSGWKLIVNKQTGQWGTEYSQGQDLERINMKVQARSSPLETFNIALDKTGGDSAVLKLQWSDTIASVDVKEKK
jgi:hypothetical protein